MTDTKKMLAGLAVVIVMIVMALIVPQPVSAYAQVVAPAPAVVESVVDPVACTGYPQPRVGVEIQAWWRDRTGEAFPGRHIHVFVCWPTGVVTGTVGLDMKVQTHGQPAGAFVKRLRATNGSGGDVFTAKTSGFTPIVSGAMTQWVHKDVVTGGLSTGLHEIRLAAYVDMGSFDQFVSSGLPLFVRSMSGGATSRDYVEARGWYPGFLYHNIRYKTRLSDFLTAKSGVWKPTFQCASPSGTGTADLFVINVNPNWHALDPGTEVLRYAGEAIKVATVDTTRFPNGKNKIVAGCEASDNLSGHDGFNRGVIAIDFKVAN